MRIVIVEDELQIREGLKNLVERIHSDYHVVGCAANGIQGLNLVKEQLPDVVITDVRMPEMDGLEMIGALNAAGIGARYIIISAYSEFAYARKAVSLGATEYILKPISIADLSESLSKVEMQMQTSARQESIDSLEAALGTLVLRGDSVSPALREKIAVKYRIGEKSNLALVLFYYGNRYDTLEKAAISATCQKLEKQSGRVSAIALEGQKSYLYILPDVAQGEEFAQWLNCSVKIHGQTLWTGAAVSLAFCQGLGGLYSAAMGLLHGLNWHISLPNTPVIRYPEVLKLQTEHCAYPISLENHLRSALCSQDTEKIRRQCEAFRQYFSGQKLYQPQEIKECYTRFLWTAATLAKEMGLISATNVTSKSVMERILPVHTLEELNSVADELIRFVCTQNAGAGEQNLVIMRAKSMIHEFYSTGINLDEIAHKLNITPEYLSTQFHKETGETFSAYIRNYRMAKAKELLIGTQLKLHQIAAQVGYADPKYFGQVFKKCTGQLPADYRRSKK